MTKKHSIKIETHINHSIVYRDGELIAILPKDAKEQWGRVAAMTVFDLVENDHFDEFGEGFDSPPF